MIARVSVLLAVVTTTSAARADGGLPGPSPWQARDRADQSLALAGDDQAPNTLTARDDSGDVSDQPLEATRATGGTDRSAAKRTWIGLGIGAGAGYANGRGVEAFDAYISKYRPGFALAALAHATPELGRFVLPNVALSLQGRLQWRPQDDPYTASGAWAVLARALFFTTASRARLYSALSFGGGDGFRLLVKARTADKKTVEDTVRGGPLLAGAGGGFSYALADRFTWIVEANLLIGMPIVSMVLDLNTGLRASF